jgi:hypothetical protein
MASFLFTSLQQLTDNSGNVLSGGSVTVYLAGTTTPLSLFSDTGLSVGASNPVTLGSDGRHGMLYFDTAAYKILVKNSGGSTIYTRDNIDPSVPLGSGVLAIEKGGTGANTAEGALAALGGFTAAEGADLAADVAAVVGALGSSEKTHIATGTTGQRPAIPAQGDIRRNTTIPQWEGYVAAWQKFMTDADLADQSTAEAGSSAVTLMTPQRSKQQFDYYSPFKRLLHVREEQAAGTDGGTFTSGSFVKRTLNTTLTNTISGASIASSVISLPAGTYFVRASAPGFFCTGHVAKLRDTTNSIDLLIGTVERTTTTVVTRSLVSGYFTLAGTTNIELQHRCTTTRSTDGLGPSANVGVVEVYSVLEIYRVA